MSKDYYHILGVDKNASPDEIKKAFRRLAHEHHPDRTGGNAEKFKEINEAYQVLSNPQKKSQYDQFGSNFEYNQTGQGFSGFGDFSDFFRGARQGGNVHFEDMGDWGDIFSDFLGFDTNRSRTHKQNKRGEDLAIELKISFKEAVFGAEKTIELNKFVKCGHCQGKGAEPGAQAKTCSTCRGTGKVEKIQRTFLGQFASASICPQCQGEGKIFEKNCSKCNGQGRVKEKVNLTLKVPAGIDNGQKVRFSRQGNAGLKNNEHGDLIVRFKVQPDAHFERDGQNIFSKEQMTFSQAVFGAKIKVETLDGELWLKIPSGTKSGQIFKLKNKGIPSPGGYGRGDHLIEVEIKIPHKITKEQKKILEDLQNQGL